MATENSSRRLETVARACAIVEALDELGGAGVTVVADHVGISKSSAHAYLNTLRERQLVVKEGTTYQLSLEFLYLGNGVRHRHVLFPHAKSVVESLAERSKEYAHLMCEQHGLERNIYKVAGENAVGSEYHTTKERKADYLHFTASGKAVLAYLPEERLERIVDAHGLVHKTSNTITDRERLKDELATIRERGYAVNDEEEIVGIRAVGVPIRDETGAVLGGMSVSGPTGRLTDETCHEEFPGLLKESANVVEARLNMSQASESLK